MKSLIPLPAFNDNYIWVWAHGRRATVVDPGDADVVERWLDENDLVLDSILITHWHPDHTGGVRQLKTAHGAHVFGPAQEADKIPDMDSALNDGDRIQVGGVDFGIMAVPGHTLGHIAFVAEEFVLCGDTLFHTGCGRLFEGTPEQMHASLARLASLPEATAVYCTHEYTLANIDFACDIEPDNQALADVRESARTLRKRGTPTIPTTIGAQKATNPFLRSEDPALLAALQARTGKLPAPGAAAFAVTRALKDAH